MISTEDFLAHVLPSEGYYCCVTFREGFGPQQFFHTKLGAIVDRILVDDANGHTVYHACATFSAPDSRAAHNARYMRSLWLDLDTQEGDDKKPYKDRDEAESAMAAFTRASGLPDPVLVDSGFGLHCYWPLDANIPAADWRALAFDFRDLCDRHGLAADHVRTCDGASILRPVGTRNRKHGDPRLVQCR